MVGLTASTDGVRVVSSTGASRVAQSEIRVPVQAWLPGPVFLELERIGKRHNLTAGQTLAELGVWALRERSKPNPSRRTYTRATPEMVKQMVALRDQGLSDREIGEVVGVSRGSVRNHLSGGAR